MMRWGVRGSGDTPKGGSQCRGVGTSVWASLLGFCPCQHATTSAAAAAAAAATSATATERQTDGR